MRPLGKTVLVHAFLWVFVALGVATSALAAEVTGLYDVVVAPADRSRDSAFTEALRQVAVRASGDRDGGERVIRVNADARRYVQRFSFQPDGTVSVGFDAATVEKLLASANLPLWGRERPMTLVWLAINDGGRVTWVSAGASGAEREAIDRAAKARGLPVVWPAMDPQDVSTVNGLQANRAIDLLTASAARYRADAVLFGVVNRSAAGAEGDFTFAFGGEVVEGKGSIEEGLHMAADRCAKLLAVPLNARTDVRVRVAGIHNLDAYARTLNYLEGLTVVRAVAIEQLHTDVLEMRLSVRGDGAQLAKTVALDRRLSADSRVATDGILNFTYSP